MSELARESLGTLSTLLIVCADFPAMRAFYRDRLGLPVIAEAEDWISFDNGLGGELVLGTTSGGDGEASIVPSFHGTDLERVRGQLLDLDPTAIAEHATGRNFWLVDPDGNELAFADRATRGTTTRS